MPAVDEAGDEEGDEEEAREQDSKHQTELTMHALKERTPLHPESLIGTFLILGAIQKGRLQNFHALLVCISCDL